MLRNPQSLRSYSPPILVLLLQITLCASNVITLPSYSARSITLTAYASSKHAMRTRYRHSHATEVPTQHTHTAYSPTPIQYSHASNTHTPIRYATITHTPDTHSRRYISNLHYTYAPRKPIVRLILDRIWGGVCPIFKVAKIPSPHSALQTRDFLSTLLSPSAYCPPIRFFSTHNPKLQFKVVLSMGLRKYYVDTKTKVIQYWQRVPRDINKILPPFANIIPTILPNSSSFTSMVVRKLAELESSQRKNSNKSADYYTFEALNSTTFTRKNFLQFLVDVHHTLDFMEAEVKRHDSLKLLGKCGPSHKSPRVKRDIYELSSIINVNPPAVGIHGQNYTATLRKIGDNTPIAFAAHMYNFYKEWSISGKHIISSASKHLNIPRHFKSAFWDADMWNIDATLEMLAAQWSEENKALFLQELSKANAMAMTLSLYFTASQCH